MRIAFIGTRGVPARYGGFETAVEEIGSRLVKYGHEVAVYCRGAEEPLDEYLGMTLVHRPALRLKQVETISHSTLSLLDVRRREIDVALVLNAANAPLIPLLRGRVPVALHVDGLEWRRAKWGAGGRLYYQAAERRAVRLADELVADSRGIQRYYAQRYGVATTFLPYGAPVLRSVGHDRLVELGLEPGRFHLVVARFEPENLIDVSLQGYHESGAEYPLVVVGSVPYKGSYTRRVERRASSHPHIRLLGAVWEQEVLNQLYAGCASYLHGHSVGGTNPSLLRAMGAGAPVIAFDVAFNREVADDTAVYFRDQAGAAEAVRTVERDPGAAARRGEAGQERVARLYDWDAVAKGYEEMFFRLANPGGSGNITLL